MIGMGSNALASSVVLVCRKRSADAPIATRRDFIAALKAELPLALVHLQRGNIAPVDLAQAAIGPGMAVYTSYAKVLDASGNRISVGDALALINQTLDETLAEQEGDFDADSRWALAWFEQYGFDAGDYGIAETLSTAKNTTVSGMLEAGILHSRGGKVRLLRPEELSADWDPARHDRLTTWEIVHHLIRVLEQERRGLPPHELVRKLGGWAEIAREFCYRLYTVCERKKRADRCAGLQRTGTELAGDQPSRQNGGTPGAGRAVRRWGYGRLLDERGNPRRHVQRGVGASHMRVGYVVDRQRVAGRLGSAGRGQWPPRRRAGGGPHQKPARHPRSAGAIRLSCLCSGRPQRLWQINGPVRMCVRLPRSGPRPAGIRTQFAVPQLRQSAATGVLGLHPAHRDRVPLPPPRRAAFHAMAAWQVMGPEFPGP